MVSPGPVYYSVFNELTFVLMPPVSMPLKNKDRSNPVRDTPQSWATGHEDGNKIANPQV
jgi:hypothetical protein